MYCREINEKCFRKYDNHITIEILCCESKNLKLVSAIIYEIFIFSPNNSPSKTMKNVFYFI